MQKTPTIMEWFYAKNNERKGPVSASQLRSMVVSGEVAGSDLVWCEGMGNWIPASEVRDFDSPHIGVAGAGAIPEHSPQSPQVVQPGSSPGAPGTIPNVGPAGVKPPANGKAIASLVCGCVGVICCNIFIPSILAVIFGHIAKGEIRASGGQQGGDGMALAGLILGYVGLGIGVLALLGGLVPS